MIRYRRLEVIDWEMQVPSVWGFSSTLATTILLSVRITSNENTLVPFTIVLCRSGSDDEQANLRNITPRPRTAK